MHHYVFSTTEFCAFIVFLKSNPPFISLTTVCNYISAPEIFLIFTYSFSFSR